MLRALIPYAESDMVFKLRIAWILVALLCGLGAWVANEGAANAAPNAPQSTPTTVA